MYNKIIGFIAVVALILSGLALLINPGASSTASQSSFAGIGGPAGSGLLSPLGTSYVYPNVSNYDYLRDNALESDKLLMLGGYSTTTTGTGIIIAPAIGSCANSASSTQFALLNPFAATSTFTLDHIIIGGNATTSSLLVGTSTTPNGVTSGTNLVNSTNGIATSSVQWAIGGQTDVPSGFIAAVTQGFEFVVVPPGQYIDAYSTSTATGVGAAGYNPGFSTCNYSGYWTY